MITSWKIQRLMARLNQTELARESRISRNRVSVIERGLDKPTREESAKLTQVLAYPTPIQQEETNLGKFDQVVDELVEIKGRW